MGIVIWSISELVLNRRGMGGLDLVVPRFGLLRVSCPERKGNGPLSSNV